MTKLVCLFPILTFASDWKLSNLHSECSLSGNSKVKFDYYPVDVQFNALTVGSCDATQVSINQLGQTSDAVPKMQFEVVYDPQLCGTNVVFDPSSLDSYSHAVEIRFDVGHEITSTFLTFQSHVIPASCTFSTQYNLDYNFGALKKATDTGETKVTDPEDPDYEPDEVVQTATEGGVTFDMVAYETEERETIKDEVNEEVAAAGEMSYLTIEPHALLPQGWVYAPARCDFKEYDCTDASDPSTCSTTNSFTLFDYQVEQCNGASPLHYDLAYDATTNYFELQFMLFLFNPLIINNYKLSCVINVCPGSRDDASLCNTIASVCLPQDEAATYYTPCPDSEIWSEENSVCEADPYATTAIEACNNYCQGVKADSFTSVSWGSVWPGTASGGFSPTCIEADAVDGNDHFWYLGNYADLTGDGTNHMTEMRVWSNSMGMSAMQSRDYGIGSLGDAGLVRMNSEYVVTVGSDAMYTYVKSSGVASGFSYLSNAGNLPLDLAVDNEFILVQLQTSFPELFSFADGGSVQTLGALFPVSTDTDVGDWLPCAVAMDDSYFYIAMCDFLDSLLDTNETGDNRSSWISIFSRVDRSLVTSFKPGGPRIYSVNAANGYVIVSGGEGGSIDNYMKIFKRDSTLVQNIFGANREGTIEKVVLKDTLIFVAGRETYKSSTYSGGAISVYDFKNAVEHGTVMNHSGNDDTNDLFVTSSKYWILDQDGSDNQFWVKQFDYDNGFMVAYHESADRWTMVKFGV